MKRIEWECEGRRFAVEVPEFTAYYCDDGSILMESKLCEIDLVLPPGTEFEVREVANAQ